MINCLKYTCTLDRSFLIRRSCRNTDASFPSPYNHVICLARCLFMIPASLQTADSQDVDRVGAYPFYVMGKSSHPCPFAQRRNLILTRPI